jgi:hypothetical protein
MPVQMPSSAPAAREPASRPMTEFEKRAAPTMEILDEVFELLQ